MINHFFTQMRIFIILAGRIESFKLMYLLSQTFLIDQFGYDPLTVTPIIYFLLPEDQL